MSKKSRKQRQRKREKTSKQEPSSEMLLKLQNKSPVRMEALNYLTQWQLS